MALNPGPNPFALYEKSGDDTFYNVGNAEAAQVALGLAMQATTASIGLVAFTSIRVNQYQTKSGG
jgi:hypothetical protein